MAAKQTKGRGVKPTLYSVLALLAVAVIALISSRLGNNDTAQVSANQNQSDAGTVAVELNDDETQPAATDAQTKAAQTNANETQSAARTLSFRNKKTLQEHYKKHGIEMGFASEEDYVAAANAVINDPAALHKTEKEDGDDVYYLEETNEFVIVSTDGYIRTYFNPSGGKAYFDRQ